MKDLDVDKIELDLKDSLSIDDSTYAKLNEEFKTHSAKHIEWSMAAAQASRKVHELKIKLKTLEAEIIKDYRDEYLLKNGKPLAATFNTKEIIPLDKRWVGINEDLAEAQEELEICSAASAAFGERGYLLREVAKFVDATTLPSAAYKSRDNLEALARGVEE